MTDTNVPQARDRGSGIPAENGSSQKPIPPAIGSPETNTPDNPDTTSYDPWMPSGPLQGP